MTIISVGCEQTDVGTTTAVTNLASIQAAFGWRVAIVDMSNKESAMNWAATRKKKRLEHSRLFKNSTEIEVVRGDRHDEKVLRDMSPCFDQVFVDAGTAEAAEFRKIMTVADEFLIPVYEPRCNEASLKRLNRVVGEAKAVNPGLKAGIFFNCASLQRTWWHYQSIMDRLNLRHHLGFYGMVQENEVFKTVMDRGRGVHELDRGLAYSHFAIKDIIGLNISTVFGPPDEHHQLFWSA